VTLGAGLQRNYIMSDFIGVDITGIEQIKAKLAAMPAAVADDGVESANIYLRGVLQRYPPQKDVTRKDAYPEVRGWFGAVDPKRGTTKQQRWFFWALRTKQISVPYQRTNRLSNAWKLYGQGRAQIIANESPGAQYVQGEWKGQQSRHENKVGWKGVNIVIEERLKQIVKAFELGANKALKKLRLKP
jgi:hypothetical protein